MRPITAQLKSFPPKAAERSRKMATFLLRTTGTQKAKDTRYKSVAEQDGALPGKSDRDAKGAKGRRYERKSG